MIKKCNNCGSEWNSNQSVTKCPFCGESLIDKNKTISTLDEGIKEIVSMFGIEILQNEKRFYSLVMDFVPYNEKEKKLLKYALNNNINQSVINILKSNDDFERETIQKQAIQVLVEQALISEENAVYILNLLSKGIGIPIVNSIPKIQNQHDSLSKEELIELEKEIHQLLSDGLIINAVKRYQEVYRVSLTEAKEAIDIISTNNLITNNNTKQNNEEYLLSQVNKNGSLTKEQILDVYKLGLKYRDLNNKELAFKLVKYAANKGNLNAITTLGDFYMNGFGVKKDSKIANAYYRNAAVHNVPEAEFKLGMDLYKSMPNKSFIWKPWIEKAAGQGYKEAVDFLKTKL